MVCLLLWRQDNSGAGVFRVRLHGLARVPVETDPGSTVTIKVGDKIHGPFKSGKKSKLVAPLPVPPGLSSVRAEATNKAGLRTVKSVDIKRPPYNRLTLMAREVPGKAPGQAKIHLLAAHAESQDEAISLEVKPHGAAAASSVKMRPGPGGLMRAVLKQVPFGSPERLEIRAHVPGEPDSVRELAIAVTPGPDYKGIARAARERRKRNAILWSGVGLTAGLLVAGIATGQAASDKSEEFRDPSTPLNLREELDHEATTLQTSSITLFALGGAAAVGTALYYWLGYRQPEKVQAAMVVGPEGTIGASVGGRF